MHQEFEQPKRKIEVRGEVALNEDILSYLENIADKVRVLVRPIHGPTARQDPEQIRVELNEGHISIHLPSRHYQSPDFITRVSSGLARFLYEIAESDVRFSQSTDPFPVWLQILEEKRLDLKRVSHEFGILSRSVNELLPEKSNDSSKLGTPKTVFGSTCHQIAISAVLTELLGIPTVFCRLNWPFMRGHPSFFTGMDMGETDLSLLDESKIIIFHSHITQFFITCINRVVVWNSRVHWQVYDLQLAGFMQDLLKNFYDVTSGHQSPVNPLFYVSSEVSRYPAAFFPSEDIITNLASLTKIWAAAFDKTFTDRKSMQEMFNLLAFLNQASQKLTVLIQSEQIERQIHQYAHEILHLIAFLNGFCEFVFARMSVRWIDYPARGTETEQLLYTIKKFNFIYTLFITPNRQLNNYERDLKKRFSDSINK